MQIAGHRTETNHGRMCPGRCWQQAVTASRGSIQQLRHARHNCLHAKHDHQSCSAGGRLLTPNLEQADIHCATPSKQPALAASEQGHLSAAVNLHVVKGGLRTYRSVNLDELRHLFKGLIVALQRQQACFQGPRPVLLEHAPEGPAQVPILSIGQLPPVWQRVHLWSEASGWGAGQGCLTAHVPVRLSLVPKVLQDSSWCKVGSWLGVWVC